VGSSVLKAAVIAADAARLQFSAPVPSGPGPATQDQEHLWEATAGLIARAGAASPSPIDAVVVTGQGDGLWTLGPGGRAPSGPAFQWNSTAGAAAVAGWEAADGIGRHFRATGTVLWAGTTAALWHHLRRTDPDRARETETVFWAKDWINYRLTGVVATDVTDATIPYLDPLTRQYDPAAFERLGTPELAGRLPDPLEPGTLLGPLTPAAARATGLAQATPVYLGVIDVVATALAAGLGGPGDAVAVLGSTSAVTPLATAPVPPGEPVGATVSWPKPDLFLRVLGSSSGGTVLDWFLRLHGFAGADRYDAFWGEVAAAAPDGPELALPFLYGERVPFLAPTATGLFAGLTPQTGRGELGRALVESLCFALRHCLEAAGPTGRLTLTGGGASDPRWCELVARVLNRAIAVDADPFIACRGAAALVPGHGLAAAGVAPALVEPPRGAPGASRSGLEERYQRYLSLIEAFKPIWKDWS
jgi:sugar (pentulose or hexulose) kinase